MKKAISIILSLSMMLSLAACGGKTETVSSESGGSSVTSEATQVSEESDATGAAEVGGDVVINEEGSVGDGSMAGREDLTFAMASETGSLDPGAYNNNWSFGVTMQIYESLLREAPGDRQTIEPVLCESYEFLDDGLTLRFHLKDGIKFHDGSIMTADDVEYSLNKAIGMPANAAMSSMMKEAVKLDDSTVDLHLEYSFGPILNIVAFPTFGIVNKEWYENAEAEGRNINTEANGTGPYKFVSWTRGDSIVLEAFDEWHGGEVAIKDLTYKFLSDSTSAAIALENGDVQALLGVSTADLKRLRENPDIFCATTYSSGMYFVGLNCAEGPFADPKVRQALQYALNAEEILVGGMDGQGWTVTCAAPRGVFGYQEDFVPSRNDVEKAKALLEEAGYPDGVQASIKCAAFDEYLMSTQIIQEQARQVGIDLEFEQMEETSFITDVFENHDFDAYYYWAGCAYPDIDSLYWRLYHSDSISKDNTAGVTELDDKLFQARTSMDNDERYELYTEITAANDENVWYIPLIMSTYTVCVRSSLSNVYANNAGLYHIADWTY